MVGELLIATDLWSRKSLKGHIYNAMGPRGATLGLPTATGCGERGRISNTCKDWFRHIVKHWRKTRDWLSMKEGNYYYSEANISLVLGSPPTHLLTWNGERNNTQLCTYCYFLVLFPSQQREILHLAVCLREGQWQRVRKGSGAVEKLQKEGKKEIRCDSWRNGKERGGYQSKKFDDSLQKLTWEPQALTIFFIKQLKRQQQKLWLVSLQHSFMKDVKQLL